VCKLTCQSENTVARKIVNICVVFALMLGCWGGVLAAAVCPHVGCETTAQAPDIYATDDNHADSHCQGATDSADSSTRDKAHEGHDAELTAEDQFKREEHQSAGSRSQDEFCAHCVDRPVDTPAPVFGHQSSSVKRGVDFAAPLAVTQIESPVPVFLRKIAPAQHAPPGRSDRHLLLNVFRI
jgi:hypothetical protein